MSQQGMTIVSTVSPSVNPWLEGGHVWSGITGKVYDVKEETC